MSISWSLAGFDGEQDEFTIMRYERIRISEIHLVPQKSCSVKSEIRRNLREQIPCSANIFPDFREATL